VTPTPPVTPVSEVTIRLARPAEYERVGRLTVEAYQASGYPGSDGPYAARLADAETRAREAELWVAVDESDAPVGTVTMAPPGSPWAQVAGARDMEFRMLAVAASARGRGVGEALTRAVLDRATELGLTAVVLSSAQEMAVAHRIYERLGFRRTPEKDWSPTSTTDLITYRLDLTQE
jgi:ribosomal protein S18 acetylase RimI-like enzyme